MLQVVDTLRERLVLVLDIGPESEPPWSKWIEQPLGLTPCQTWTLLGLVRHRNRHEFVADTLKMRLDADSESLASACATWRLSGTCRAIAADLHLMTPDFGRDDAVCLVLPPGKVENMRVGGA